MIDYAEISEVVNRGIVQRLDHQNLNDLFDFKTTAENLALHIMTEVQRDRAMSSRHSLGDSNKHRGLRKQMTEQDYEDEGLLGMGQSCCTLTVR